MTTWTWNYRVMQQTKHGWTWCEIHEVYYDDNGVVCGWTADPCWPQGETSDELWDDIKLMREACAKPVLDINWLEEQLKERGNGEDDS